MIDRKSTGRISEDRKVHKRSRHESSDKGSNQEIPQLKNHVENSSLVSADKKLSDYQEFEEALAALNLPDLNVSEVTAIERIKVGDQTVVQLKTGDFVKYAMVDHNLSSGSEKS